MKKLMIIFMAFATFAMTAQNNDSERKQPRKELRANYTPEQKAELHSKKMALHLNLNDSQQKKVKALYLDMAKNKPVRSANAQQMTDQQKFEAKNAMLDRRLAMKRQLKEILTEEQFTKWEKSQRPKRNHSRTNKSHEKGGRGR